MKKIANITQTYQTNAQFATGTDGKDREFLIDFLIKDKSQLKLREKLDLHTFTFHNYDEQKAKIIFNKIKKVLPNTKSLIYNNMTLGNSLKLHLQFLKEREITDVLWIQDDEFSLVDEQDLLDFFDFYKNEKQIENVALARDCKYINDCEQKEKIKINENLFLYKTECKHFEESKNYAMDFSTFMCSIDFLIDVFLQSTLIIQMLINLKENFQTIF